MLSFYKNLISQVTYSESLGQYSTLVFLFMKQLYIDPHLFLIKSYKFITNLTSKRKNIIQFWSPLAIAKIIYTLARHQSLKPRIILPSNTHTYLQSPNQRQPYKCKNNLEPPPKKKSWTSSTNEFVIIPADRRRADQPSAARRRRWRRPSPCPRARA